VATHQSLRPVESSLLSPAVISWSQVAQGMARRDKAECRNKWKQHYAATLKFGEFTEEEDEVIRRKVENWGSKRGLWTALEKELGRPDYTIKMRWNNDLSKSD
jgi:hypothetical protein